MTAIRTSEGICLKNLNAEQQDLILKKSLPFAKRGLLKVKTGQISLLKEGRLRADGIASDLFFD
jgi:hypothetical protein